LNPIIQLDHHFFLLINSSWTNSFFDRLFPIITDLHLNLFGQVFLGLIFILWVFKQKKTVLPTLGSLVLSFVLSEAITHRMFKPHFARQRPEFSLQKVQLRSHSHSGYSFPSTHASNSFALATVLALIYSQLAPVFLFFAFLIAYSRVYVGVHFPSDVIGGALLGIAIGWIISFVMTKLRSLPLPNSSLK
jgi:undecaprenyl-diphosphatase